MVIVQVMPHKVQQGHKIVIFSDESSGWGTPNQWNETQDGHLGEPHGSPFSVSGFGRIVGGYEKSNTGRLGGNRSPVQ